MSAFISYALHFTLVAKTEYLSTLLRRMGLPGMNWPHHHTPSIWSRFTLFLFYLIPPLYNTVLSFLSCLSFPLYALWELDFWAPTKIVILIPPSNRLLCLSLCLSSPQSNQVFRLSNANGEKWECLGEVVFFERIQILSLQLFDVRNHSPWPTYSPGSTFKRSYTTDLLHNVTKSSPCLI
jgi:hypothetical protein